MADEPLRALERAYASSGSHEDGQALLRALVRQAELTPTHALNLPCPSCGFAITLDDLGVDHLVLEPHMAKVCANCGTIYVPMALSLALERLIAPAAASPTDLDATTRARVIAFIACRECGALQNTPCRTPPGLCASRLTDARTHHPDLEGGPPPPAHILPCSYPHPTAREFAAQCADAVAHITCPACAAPPGAYCVGAEAHASSQDPLARTHSARIQAAYRHQTHAPSTGRPTPIR